MYGNYTCIIKVFNVCRVNCVNLKRAFAQHNTVVKMSERYCAAATRSLICLVINAGVKIERNGISVIIADLIVIKSAVSSYFPVSNYVTFNVLVLIGAFFTSRIKPSSTCKPVSLLDS